MAVLEFDKIEEWEPLFAGWMQEIAPVEVYQAAAQPQDYIDEAGALFVEAIGKGELTAFLAAKLADHKLRVFHGTRVSDATLAKIRHEGLTPLNLFDRRSTLVADLQAHPDWALQEPRLDSILQKYGPDGEILGAGKREDDVVHVFLSRMGLLKGCNYYLTHGAEVDDFIVRDLFSDESGLPLLANARKPVVVSFVLDFAAGELAANPANCEYEGLPYLAELFLRGWAIRLSEPEWTPALVQFTNALKVHGAVPPEELSFEFLTDADLDA
jgi:hypothetical protein